MERKLPNPICGSICKLSMSERCIDVCAPQGDMELLQVREDLVLGEMPMYPDMEQYSWRARVRLNEAYTKKIVEHLTGTVRLRRNGIIYNSDT